MSRYNMCGERSGGTGTRARGWENRSHKYTCHGISYFLIAPLTHGLPKACFLTNISHTSHKSQENAHALRMPRVLFRQRHAVSKRKLHHQVMHTSHRAHCTISRPLQVSSEEVRSQGEIRARCHRMARTRTSSQGERRDVAARQVRQDTARQHKRDGLVNGVTGWLQAGAHMVGVRVTQGSRLGYNGCSRGGTCSTSCRLSWCVMEARSEPRYASLDAERRRNVRDDNTSGAG